MTEDGSAPGYAGTFPAEPAAVARIRGAIAALATRCGFSPVEIHDVRIAVTEIATNAILHGYADTKGEIRVSARFARGELEVVVADDGPGMAPRLESPGAGLGLPAAASAASDLKILTPDEGGTEVHLTFRRARCAGAS